MKKLLLLFPFILLGQNVDPVKDASFSYYNSTSASGSASVITVQNNATSQKNVNFKSVYLYCSVACTINIEVGGTAATSTAVSNASILNINPGRAAVQTSYTNVFSGSNAGSGNILNQIQLNGNGASVDLTNFVLMNGKANNLTFRSNSITGTVIIAVSWYEQ